MLINFTVHRMTEHNSAYAAVCSTDEKRDSYSLSVNVFSVELCADFIVSATS